MFSEAYTQYQDLQLPSWNEFDCDDVEGDGALPQENSNALSFEHQLVNDIDKHVSGNTAISHFASSTGSDPGSSSVSVPASSGSSISSASSYNAQIFDSVNLLNLTSFPTKSSVDDDNLMSGGMITSPVSSCVSPTLTNVNSMEKNNYNMSNMDYRIEPGNNNQPYHFAFDTNYIGIKQEGDELHLPSHSNDNVSPSSSSSSTSALASTGTSSSYLSTLEEKTNTVVKNENSPPSSASTTKKPKESKSGGRIKKPMTMVQRKAHNKIERKYRININSKIANLQKLVPWMSEDGVAFEIDSKSGKKVPVHGCGNNNNDDEADTSQIPSSASNKKLNKSMILDMVTEYLLLLKDECRKKDAEISELKTKLSESSVSY